MIYEKRSRKKGNTLSKSDFANRAPREVENVCAMSAASSADEPRGPFLIILHPRHPHRARAALVIFSFFSFFFLFIAREATVWCRRGTERVDWTTSEVNAWNGDPEKARRKKRGERGREKDREEKRGREDGRGSEEEEYF